MANPSHKTNGARTDTRLTFENSKMSSKYTYTLQLREFCAEETKKESSLMDNACDSQIPITSCSNLLPSEPPDVGNWLSSYKYESFVLDTCDEFGGSIFKESDSGREDSYTVARDSDKEENLYVSERNGTNDRKREKWFLREMPYTTVAPSPLYALANERNWLSSYVSESPIDPFFDNEESIIEGSECPKDGFPIHVDGNIKEEEGRFEESSNSGNNNKVGAGNNAFTYGFAKSKRASRHDAKNESLNKITDSQQLSSFSPEPSDIGSWYCSCAYESPVRSEIKGFLEETQCREGDNFEEDNKRERATVLQNFTPTMNIDSEFINDKVCSSQNLTFKISPDSHRRNMHVKKGIRLEGKENSSPWINLCHDSKQRGQAFEKDVRNFPKAGVVYYKNNMNTTINVGNRPHSFDCEERSTESLKVRLGAASSGNSMRFNLVNVASVRKFPCGNDENQSEGNKMLGKGFVTTRAGRTKVNDENSTNWPQAVLLKCSRNKETTPSANEDFVIKRKVLRERTNFEGFYADEVTGKWRCPKKDKPNIRPQKQLRLDQWILRP